MLIEIYSDIICPWCFIGKQRLDKVLSTDVGDGIELAWRPYQLYPNLPDQGIDRGDKDTILSLMSVDFEAGEDGAGEVLLTLAGDGAIRLSVEAIEVTLKDVTRPYQAPSGQAPHHPE